MGQGNENCDELEIGEEEDKPWVLLLYYEGEEAIRTYKWWNR
jgi:hypothetical protein